MFDKIIFAFLVITLMSGCSTFRPVEMTSEQVQQKISAGELIAVGDEVKVATVDGKTYDFEVKAVTDQQILGDEVGIPIDEVVAIETREFSRGKTAALLGGVAVLWGILLAASLDGAYSFGYDVPAN